MSIIRVPPPSDEKKTIPPGVSSKILELHQAGGWNYGSNIQYHVADVLCFPPPFFPGSVNCLFVQFVGKSMDMFFALGLSCSLLVDYHFVYRCLLDSF